MGPCKALAEFCVCMSPVPTILVNSHLVGVGGGVAEESKGTELPGGDV